MINLFNISDTTDYEFFQNQIGTDVYVNGSSSAIKTVITNTNIEQNYDDKRFLPYRCLNVAILFYYRTKSI